MGLGVCAALAILSKFTALAFLPCTAVMLWSAMPRSGGLGPQNFGRSSNPSRELRSRGGHGEQSRFGWFTGSPSALFHRGASSFRLRSFLTASSWRPSTTPSDTPPCFLDRIARRGGGITSPRYSPSRPPLAYLLLLIPGGLVVARRRTTLRYLLPLAYKLGILVAAMAGSVKLGVRHILPIHAGLSIVAALGLVRLFHRQPGVVTAIAGAVVRWMAASGARSHPDYLSYFNELTLEARRRVTMDSDLDWGRICAWRRAY